MPVAASLSAIHKKRGLLAPFLWNVESGFEPSILNKPGSTRALQSKARERRSIATTAPKR